MRKLPLYKQIQDDIKKQIAYGSFKPGDRIPSEMDLARKYFVSQITSKNALNGMVEEGYLYRIQGKGTFVSANTPAQHNVDLPANQIFYQPKKGTIGLLIPAMVTKVSQKLLNYIEKYISLAGYHLMIRVTRESITDEAFTINSFRAEGVKGLIIFPVVDEVYNESILRLALDRFPIVLVDRYLKKISVNSVVSDNIAGMEAATKYLIDKGHRNVSIISPKITNSAVEDRIIGYENCLSANKIPIDRNEWCIMDFDINETDYAFHYIKEFFQNHKSITAALCVNAEMAQCAYYTLTSMGKSIPTQFELISFDQPYLDGVSYIAQNEQVISRKSVDLLLSQIDGSFDVNSVKVPTEFVDVSSKDKLKPPYHLLYVLNQGDFST